MIQSKGVKNISAKSIRLIRRMINAVLAEPELLDQETFGDPAEPVCETACCGAGWAIWLKSPKLYKKLLVLDADFKDSGGADWTGEALKALDLRGVGDDPAYALFGNSGMWPSPFSDQYYLANTPKARAKVFAARWEKFIDSDGAV